MTQEQSSTLTFSIEDSVWLNKGQQIDEIIGMSLTPEIYVKQVGEHVTIKGGLRFVGEYKMDQGEVEEAETEASSFSELSDFRQSGEITADADTGVGEIEHLFPIDITIPMARIQHVDDIYVQVASFDYDLPEKSCIQLTADVSISGMKTEESTSQPEEEIVDEQEEEPTETAFHFEAYQDEQEPVLEEPVQYREEEPVAEDTTLPVEQDIVETYTHDVIQNNWKQVEVEAVTEKPKEQEVRFNQKKDSNDDLVESSESKSSYSSLAAMSNNHKEMVRELEEEEEEIEPVAKQSKLAENASYLTNMLRNEEEQFSKWKMCIIQDSDTLQSIAERYELSTSQLTRYNNLDSEKVEEGQILYIPVSAK
ncbi:stage VI sporulation protein D [Alkalihalobacillus xiaoxiensis]|uniref:Stage VI sporulation protein D n=1 Tax=Shouchella xiaoxiensis TaxID=766895 RepID=A0ABS2SSS8_9BACI|nr:stage VI sporulation protein D [Shouchella xiaoxiensis]MBM7838564.1 stage VI sporulation protein D [Shouchella xiaoxiensis]